MHKSGITDFFSRPERAAIGECLLPMKVPRRYDVVDHVRRDEGVLGEAEVAVDVGLALLIVAVVQVGHLKMNIHIGIYKTRTNLPSQVRSRPPRSMRTWHERPWIQGTKI